MLCKKKTILGQTIDDSTEEIDNSIEEIDIFCCNYCNKEFKTLKGMSCHENLYCKQKSNAAKKSCNKKVHAKQQNTCYRCGREGHFSSDCYASKHKNGKYLT